MPEPLIRKIEEKDFYAVTSLLSELGRPAVTPETESVLKEHFEAYLSDFSQHALIAFVDGQPVGFLSLELRIRLNWTTFEAWIPDFIVTEVTRGTGVGHALFEQAVAIARTYDCHRLILESGYARQVAHQFYEAHGMTNSGYYFTLKP